jgi:hypothetical protein
MRTVLPRILCLLFLAFVGLGSVFSQEQLGEPLPTDLGTTLERESGGFINVRIVAGRFRVYFLDKDSNLVEPVYPAGVIRYAVKKEYNRKITVNVGQPQGKYYLEGVRVISPPYRYYLTLILVQESKNPIPGLPEQEVYNRILLNQL